LWDAYSLGAQLSRELALTKAGGNWHVWKERWVQWHKWESGGIARVSVPRTRYVNSVTQEPSLSCVALADPGYTQELSPLSWLSSGGPFCMLA